MEYWANAGRAARSTMKSRIVCALDAGSAPATDPSLDFGVLQNLEQLSFECASQRIAEVLVGRPAGDPAAGSALQEADLDQVRLVQVLDGAAVFADRGRQSVHADRAAAEALDDG